MRPRNILFMLVDGLGLPDDLSNSLYRHCPELSRLLSENTVELDAGLGFSGIPQSATGQTVILTGVNAIKQIGGHLSGFPNTRLRQIIEQDNIFLHLAEQGLSCTFANAYVSLPEINMPLSLRSVTTVAAMKAGLAFRTRSDLLSGTAVYHDITRQWLKAKGENNIPCIDEESAAEHLLNIMRGYDFTLFEYFLTDHAGHRGEEKDKIRILRSLERFIVALLSGLNRQRELFLLTSDHGNIENLDNRFHSTNPVPWLAVGYKADDALRGISNILEITPKIGELLSDRKEETVRE